MLSFLISAAIACYFVICLIYLMRRKVKCGGGCDKTSCSGCSLAGKKSKK